MNESADIARGPGGNEGDQAAGGPAFPWRNYLIDSLALLLGDGLVILLSLVLGDLVGVFIYARPFRLAYSLLLIPAWWIEAYVLRLVPGWGSGAVEELRRIQTGLALIFGATAILLFFTYYAAAASRLSFLVAMLLTALFMAPVRALVRRLLLAAGLWGVPVVVYGDRETAPLMVKALRDEPSLGYLPAAVYSDAWPAGSVVEGVPVRGGAGAAPSAPVAVVALPRLSRHEQIALIEGPLSVCRTVVLVPDLLEAPSLWVHPRDFRGILGLELSMNLLDPVLARLKRGSELGLIVLTVPLWAPLLLVVALLVWLQDRRWPFFLQERVGRRGRLFRARKFRTMVPDAEEALRATLSDKPDLRSEWENGFKLRSDPRVTRLGRWLRRASLDELPQVLNVLRGEMALIGPRPLPPYHQARLPERQRELRERVRPGITGLWQVSGRSEAGPEDMAHWDTYYVRNWSLWLDMVILARTFSAVLTGRGAY